MILRKRKDDPVLPRGKSSYFKSKMISLESNICHNSVMSIRKFFIDRDEPAHLVYPSIHDMEVIGDTSSEGANGIDQLFAAAFLVDGSATL